MSTRAPGEPGTLEFIDTLRGWLSKAEAQTASPVHQTANALTGILAGIVAIAEKEYADRADQDRVDEADAMAGRILDLVDTYRTRGDERRSAAPPVHVSVYRDIADELQRAIDGIPARGAGR